MTTLILASLYALKFEGGTPNDFVNALAASTQQSVVMSQGDPKALPRAEFETTDLNEMSRAVRSQLKHLIYPGTDLAIGDQMLAREMVSENRAQRFQGGEAEILIAARARANIEGEAEPINRPNATLSITSIGLPATAVKDGKVTFKTEKSESLQLIQLSGLSKPVRVHWVYRESPVFLNVRELPEADFIRVLAKTVGARFVSTTKEYAFDFDPVEIRKRAVATIQAMPISQRNPQVTKSQQNLKNFRMSIINALSPAQLTEALAETGSTARFELSPRSPLTRIAVQRVQQLDAERLEAARNGTPGEAAYIPVMQRVDGSRTPILTVDSRFSIRMEIPVLNQNGQPSGVVRL